MRKEYRGVVGEPASLGIEGLGIRDFSKSWVACGLRCRSQHKLLEGLWIVASEERYCNQRNYGYKAIIQCRTLNPKPTHDSF